MSGADTPPVCGACDDRDPFCCGGSAAVGELLERPHPVEVLLAEQTAVERDLWAALMRHQRAHGCGPGLDRGDVITCDLDLMLSNAWCRTRDMDFAMRWVLGRVEVPFGPSGIPHEVWALEYYCGPWPTLADGTVFGHGVLP